MIRRFFAGDALWAASGQAATALGAVIGVRLLTEFVSPATFGAVSLVVGVNALAMNMTTTPLNQAAAYLYPEAVGQGSQSTLRATLFCSLRRMGRWFLPLSVLAAAAIVALHPDAVIVVALLALLLACDCWRAVDMSFLNAARQQRRYALWSAGEAWARPLLAAVAVVLLRDSTTVVLAAYLVASAVLLQVFSNGRRWADVAAVFAARTDEPAPLERAMWAYALPLIPVGLIGWTNGLADRYIIGGLLSIEDAGIYAAAYALASRPFLILGQSVELAARPVYQNAVSAGQTDRANRLLAQWFAIVAGVGLAGVAVFTLWRSQLAALLLGEHFRAGADLMPWIAGGYWLLILSHVFTRVCFAHGRTQWVLAILVCAAVGGVVATTIGAIQWGLLGAAAAVVVCFAIQLGASIVAARVTYRQAQGSIAGISYG